MLCIALTGSRGGFLGLLLCGLIHGVIARRWWKHAATGLILVPLLWLILPTYLRHRFETIIWPEVGPQNAQLSAEGRFQRFFIVLDLWRDNPVTGCGPGLWKVASGEELESHNLYGQVLGEMGTLGAITFGATLVAAWANMRKINAMYRSA